jgi:hypothetical protein
MNKILIRALRAAAVGIALELLGTGLKRADSRRVTHNVCASAKHLASTQNVGRLQVLVQHVGKWLDDHGVALIISGARREPDVLEAKLKRYAPFIHLGSN